MHKNNNYYNVLNKLQDYMFTNKNMNFFSSLKNKKEEKKFDIDIDINFNILMPVQKKSYLILEKKMETTANIKKEHIKKELPISNLVFPKHRDQLFWSLYMIKKEGVEYELLKQKVMGHITMITEKELKIEYIEKIRSQKQKIKSYKLAAMNHLENSLLNDNVIDLKTFVAICIVDNVNVFYIHKNTYVEIQLNEDVVNTLVIHRQDNPLKYAYEKNIDKDKLQRYRDKYYKIDNIDKPIKSLSSYKLQELIDLSKKILIDINNKETGKPKKKQELFESLIQYFS